MTRHGKCDICRSRKVKCDQRIPACSQCAKRGRPCTYRSAATLSRAHDSSEIVRPAPTGGGVFYAFASRMARKVPSNAQDLLLAKCTHMNDELSREWSWFDPFVSEATIRIGADSTLNQAIAFTCASYTTFRHRWSGEHDLAAQKAGAKALITLRQGIVSRRDDKNDVAIIAGLLCVGELLRSFGGIWNFYVHLRACAKLLAMNSTHDKPASAMEEKAIYMVLIDEVDHAIDKGACSAFDGVALPTFCSLAKRPDDGRLPNAFQVTFELLIQIPRLVNSVRACVDGREGGDLPSCVEALEQIVQDVRSCEDHIEAVIDSLGKPCGNAYGTSKGFLPTVTTFQSAWGFDLALHYFTLQMLLCGIIDTMRREHDLSLLGGLEKASELLSRELFFARRVAMCIPYAMHQHQSDAFLGLRLMIPLKHAYGSFERVCRRQQADEVDATESMLLKQYCYDTICAIMGFWGAGKDELPSHALIYSCCRTSAGYELAPVPFVDAPENYDATSYANWIARFG